MDILNLIDKHLWTEEKETHDKSGLEKSTKILYLKMKGDFNRYLGEIYEGRDKKKELMEKCYAKSFKAYNNAIKISKES